MIRVFKECPCCKGAGVQEVYQLGYTTPIKILCPACDGEGKIYPQLSYTVTTTNDCCALCKSRTDGCVQKCPWIWSKPEE